MAIQRICAEIRDISSIICTTRKGIETCERRPNIWSSGPIFRRLKFCTCLVKFAISHTSMKSHQLVILFKLSRPMNNITA